MNTKIIILLLCCITACKTNKENSTATATATATDTATATANTTQEDSTLKEETNWSQRKYKAGVIFKPEDIAGCDYVIKMEDGRVLEPINLVDSLKKNNLRIWLRYHPAETQVSVCMMGAIVMLDDVQYRK